MISKPKTKVRKRKNPKLNKCYPFLFWLPKNNEGLGTKKVLKDTWFVKIANFDYVFSNVKWMDDEELGNLVFVPDVDITLDTHIFYSEKEAMKFIQKWWKNN